MSNKIEVVLRRVIAPQIQCTQDQRLGAFEQIELHAHDTEHVQRIEVGWFLPDHGFVLAMRLVKPAGALRGESLLENGEPALLRRVGLGICRLRSDPAVTILVAPSTATRTGCISRNCDLNRRLVEAAPCCDRRLRLDSSKRQIVLREPCRDKPSGQSY